MKTLLILLALSISFGSRAEIIIYSQTYTTTTTGQGKVRSYAFTGYVVVDMDGGLWELDARTVNTVFGKRKQFIVREIDDYDVYYVSSGVLKESMVVTAGNDALAGGTMAKGSVSSITGPWTGTQYSRIAKTLALSGFTITGATGDEIIRERKGTLTFSSPRTIAANVAGNDLNATVSALKSVLASKGYQFVDEFEDFDP